MRRRTAIASALFLPLSACAAPPVPEISASEVASNTSLPTKDYFEAVTSAHAYQIASAKLALERSKVPFHRTFAATIIDTHGRTLADLKSAGRPSRLIAAEPLHPSHQRWLTELATVDAAAFDALYPRNQGNALETIKRLHGAYALYGDDPRLRRIAAAAMRTAEEQEIAMRMRPLGDSRR